MSATALPEELSPAAREFASRTHHLLIDGEATPADHEATFDTFDPATGQPITSVALAREADVDRAVKAARRAFDESDWPTLPAARRARLLQRFADLVEEHADELAELESLDNGKPLKMAKLIAVAD